MEQVHLTSNIEYALLLLLKELDKEIQKLSKEQGGDVISYLSNKDNSDYLNYCKLSFKEQEEIREIASIIREQIIESRYNKEKLLQK